MKFFCVIAILFCSVTSYANWNTEWFTGVVVLNSSQVVSGSIAIKSDAVMVKTGLHVDVLPAHRVNAIRYFDTQANVNRKFVVHCDSSANHTRFEILEVVVSGKLSVLRKPRGDVRPAPGNREAAFHYFVQTDEGLQSFRSFSRTLLPKLRTSHLALERYIRQSKIRVHDKADIIRLVMYYNRCNVPESCNFSE